MTTEQETTNSLLVTETSFSSTSNKFRRIGTLRRRLLITLLPTVLLPLTIGSGIAYRLTERRAIDREYLQLENNAYLSSNAVTALFQEYFQLNDVIASNTIAIEAMREGNQQTQADNLPSVPIEVLEEKFATTKLLISNDKLNQYLTQVVEKSNIVEIILTERNGLNVGYSDLTSDFVQRDEFWWRTSLLKGKAIGETELDESANTLVFSISQEVIDPDNKMFLGMMKTLIPLDLLNTNLASYLSNSFDESEVLQIYNPITDSIIGTITNTGSDIEIQEILGGEPIALAAQIIIDSIISRRSLTEIRQAISNETDFSKIVLNRKEIFSEVATFARLENQNKIYTLSTIPGTNLITITSTAKSEIAAAGRSLLVTFALTTIILGVASLGVIIFLARQITQPLTDLSATTQQAAAGNLDVEANLKGTLETQILADNFNNLVKKVKESLKNQKVIADEQRQQKEQLEQAIVTLLDDVSDATEGDLTVRANLDSLELSTVADLFNAIITNLQDIAIEAKQSTNQVGDSLKQNESAIRSLAEKAIEETRETRDTLLSVQQMTQSIQTVAQNASQAEQIVDDTYNTVLNSTQNMDLTVESILDLRTTVNESAKKMQRLGESSRKITQAVSLIEEIALKTNVLAINASAEADRAGEYGQGFAVVAQQVGTLAEQCSAATQEIANIVTAIQIETEEVGRVMESGTAKVLETTGLVEFTKESLSVVLQKSQEINQLMSSISQSTVSQADTSQNVTNLMQKIARLSETTSQSSQEVAQSIVETAQVAAKLQSTVAQFKVTDL